MVFFSVASIPILIPFLNILLGQEQLVLERSEQLWSKEGIVNFFYYQLSQVILTQGESRALLYLCMGIILIFFFKNCFRYLSVFFIIPARNGIVRDLRQHLFHKTMILPLSYFSDERKGDLMSRITADVQEIEHSILHVLQVVIREPLLIIGAIILMLLISPKLTLFIFLLLIFVTVVIGGIGKALRRKSTAVQEKLGNLVSTIEEGLSGLKIIKGFDALSYQEAKFKKENNQYRRLLNRLLWRKELASPLSEFLGISTVAILIWYGFQEVQNGAIDPATFIAFLYAFYGVIDPAKKFSKASYNIQKGLAAMDRVESILDAEVSIQEIPAAKSIKQLQSHIEFRSVNFKYKNEAKKALADINLKINKGQIIALVGASGGGKSTLVDLLPRFHDVAEGGIFIDGINIKQYKLGDLRGLMGIVTQEALLFNDTIYNNIVFGLEHVSELDVIEAAKIANAHEFIITMEKGYESNVGDRGNKLSGGQRQRITIARAILRNPPILILDEATSALDSESERLVQDALAKVMQNRTALVIAHRLSTIRHADEIIVLKEGKIIERGKHAELIKQAGAYQKLVALQTF